MKALGLYSTDMAVVRTRVAEAGLEGVFLKGPAAAA